MFHVYLNSLQGITSKIARFENLDMQDMSTDSGSKWCGRNGALVKIVKGIIGCRRHGCSFSGSGVGFGRLLD